MAYSITFEELQTRLRQYLQDTDTSIWESAPLNRFINDAITVHTTEVPIPASVAVNVVADQQEYTLPDDYVQAKLVSGYFTDTNQEYFVQPLELERDEPFAWVTDVEPIGFLPHFPDEGSYFFPYAPTGSTFTLYYWKKIVGTLEDDEDVLTLGTRYWSALAINALAAYFAHLPSATYRAYLEQWARKQDLNVSNPLQEMADAYLREYERVVNLFTRGGRSGG